MRIITNKKLNNNNKNQNKTLIINKIKIKN